MQKFPRCWDKISCVNFLQRKIIINSIAYYELDNPVLSDKQYDELCRQLVSLQKTVDISHTQYGYCFQDFDGSTGFDLYGRLNEYDKTYLKHIAEIGLRSYKSETNPPTKKVKKKKKGGLF